MELTEKEVKNHYLGAEVKKTLFQATKLGKFRQAMITGFKGWYRYREKNGRTEMALKPFKERIYENQIKKWMDDETRSFYWSNNFFEPKIFRTWIKKEDKEKNKVSKPGGYGTTKFYRLGIDIDLLDKDKLEGLEKDRSVDKPDSRKMLENAGQFTCDWFTDHGLSYEALRP